MNETIEPSDEPSRADGEAAPPGEVQALEAKVAEQAARLDEVLRAYSRLQQDHDDFRKRLERERDRVALVERGNVAMGLLEAVDDLDRSLGAAPPECRALVEGVRLIREGLLRRALAGGITPIPVQGETFDPTLHEAMELVACDRPEDDGRIAEEIRAGYRQGDRVLRPAQVRVGRFAAPVPAPASHHHPKPRRGRE